MYHKTKTPVARTAGWIAMELLVPIHRVQYIIRTRGIRPIAKAGNTGIYDREAVARIRHEINAIEARRAGGAK